MVAAQKVALNNGVLMDQLGSGMGRVPPPEAAALAYSALESGYRHIDTTALYGNEPGVGEAVRRFISAGSASRENTFLTTNAEMMARLAALDRPDGRIGSHPDEVN